MRRSRTMRTASSDRGTALLTVLLLLTLVSAMLAGFSTVIMTDQRVRGVDRTRTKAFYAAHEIEGKEQRSGKNIGKIRRYQNWPKRLKTQPGDTELLTRHEIQQHCPDVLITNYSMLEYMLLRPIERNIFSQTKQWLHSNKDNYFILVLDEAHTYRGAAGAEVALLVRRLQARLEIPRERFRCILTSASLGNTAKAREATLQFAHDLTGLSTASSRRIVLITGTDEKRSGARANTVHRSSCFSSRNLRR